jgi:mercuric ion transport protein
MINTILDKVGATGVWLSALSCTACFPALGSFATAFGLGFLSRFEGIAINTLLPIFASLALLVNCYSWFKNRQHLTSLFAVAGPTAVLLSLYPLWQYSWSTHLFYAGIMLMVVTSVLDIINPIKERRCER